MGLDAGLDWVNRRIAGALRRTSPASRRARIVFWVIVAATLAGPLASHLHKAFDPERPHGDWFSIYSIAQYSWDTGELEADEADDTVRTQRYPPITRPMLMLLAIPPKGVSAVLSFALFAGLYGWCAWQVSRICLGPTPHGRIAGAALAVGLVLPYAWSDLVAGNLTSVLLASVTGAFVLAERGRPFRAGLVLSVGIMLKIIPVLCLLYFVMRRKWAVAWGVGAGIVAFGVLPSLALFGPQRLVDYHGYWYREHFSMYTPMRVIDRPIECTYQNQAVVRTMVRLFTPINAGSSGRPFHITIAEPPRWVIKAAYIAIMGITGLAFVGWQWHIRRDKTPGASPTGYAMCVGAMLWFSPWVGSYYYSLAMWPAAALAGHVLRNLDEPRAARWSQRALLLWVAAMPAIGSYFLRACGVHTATAGVLLIALAAMLHSRRNENTATRAWHPACVTFGPCVAAAADSM